MAESLDRLEKLGSSTPDEKVVAAVERASKAIAFRIARSIDRRTVIIGAVGLMLTSVISGTVGYAIGTTEFVQGPIAVCWQQNGARICAPAAWLDTGK